MSVQAISWALEWAPVGDPVAAHVLVVLADAAGTDGVGAWPAVSTIEWRTRLGRTAVKRCLRDLEKAGLIRRGDQARAGHLRADHRPVVWDLAMDLRRPAREAERGSSADPRAGVVSRPSQGSRGSSRDATGVVSRPPRGSRDDPNPSDEPSGESDQGREGADAPSPREIDAAIKALKTATGRTVDREWAQTKVIPSIIGKRRDIRNRCAYIAKAIRDEPNPSGRFLPASQPPRYVSEPRPAGQPRPGERVLPLEGPLPADHLVRCSVVEKAFDAVGDEEPSMRITMYGAHLAGAKATEEQFDDIVNRLYARFDYDVERLATWAYTDLPPSSRAAS